MVVSVAFCEIFSVKEWCNLENRVTVRSRSLEMAPFNRSHTSSYSPSIATIAITCIVCSGVATGGGTCSPNRNPARPWDSPRSEEKIFRGGGRVVLPDCPVTPVTQCRTTTVAQAQQPWGPRGTRPPNFLVTATVTSVRM